MENKSDQLNELFTALAKAQAEFQVAGRKSENPFFKSSYADLTEIIKASRPALTKYGLSVIQSVNSNSEGNQSLVTMLCHSSGQYVSSNMKISPSKPDIQSLASYISYLRRYSYSALVGVVTSDEDDDGEVAMSRESNKFNINNEMITADQLEELEHELQDHPDIAQQVLNGWNIKRLRDMPKNKFLVSISRIRDLKQNK